MAVNFMDFDKKKWHDKMLIRSVAKLSETKEVVD